MADAAALYTALAPLLLHISLEEDTERPIWPEALFSHQLDSLQIRLRA